MTRQSLENRVEILERTTHALEGLPDRVTALASQVLQLRDEVHAEFSALRVEIRGGDEQTRQVLRREIRVGDDRLREEIRAAEEKLRDEIRAGDEETRRQLREDIRGGDEETRRYMRVLHEEVISRIALLDEHRNGR